MTFACHHLSVTTFHVRFERPNGWTYELWPSAENQREAIAAADDLLEYVERIGIRDYLNPDGITVRNPARLCVRPTAENPASEISLRITTPDGRTIEKYRTTGHAAARAVRSFR
jgi:hypothetical protein